LANFESSVIFKLAEQVFRQNNRTTKNTVSLNNTRTLQGALWFEEDLLHDKR